MPFAALWGLIKSNEHGYILIDTGYAQRNNELSRNFPHNIFNKITEVKISKSNEAISQLKQMGINPMDIKHIIVSHFHIDHVGGLLDFPEAKIWCKKEALDHILRYPSLFTVTKGYLKGLLPDDILNRVQYVDQLPLSKMDGLKKCWNFIDPSITLIDLPGHARGHIGMLHKPSNKFLIIDAGWTTQNIVNLKYPRRIVSFLIDSYKELKQTIKMLNQFQKNNPNIEMIPTHCPIIFDKYFKIKVTS